ncbi:DNA mismatch repair protein msh6, partial [Coemansia nantahalensis]
MPYPRGSSTPKGKRTQTSIASFFSTPQAKRTAQAIEERDSQDELLDQVGAVVGDDLLADIVQAESALATPQKAARHKRKAADMEVDDAEGSAAAEEPADPPSDDDNDDDYNPAAPRRANGPGPKTPSLARLRYSSTGSSGSSVGTPLARGLASPLVPSLSRAGSSSDSAPLLQRMQSQAATPSDAKRARATAFAKKNEERYAWLEGVRDAQQLRPDEVGYDPRTLYIPAGAWKQFSPFEKQYWEIKSQHWDTVVFFKKGKFYELYENDATIAHQ